jgi:protein CpxP
MKVTVAVLASSLLLGGAVAPLLAQSDTSNSSDSANVAMMKADAKREMKVEKHISDLHAKLKITSDEETQWAAVSKAMHESANELDRAIDKREAKMKDATAIDDLNAYGDIAQAHADAVKKLSEAFSPLYAAMPDDQKRVADDVFAHRQNQGKHAGKMN